jgi:hypothetical protein
MDDRAGCVLHARGGFSHLAAAETLNRRPQFFAGHGEQRTVVILHQ